MDLFLKECMETAAPLGLDFSSRKGIGEEINMLAIKYIRANDRIKELDELDSNLVDAKEYTDLQTVMNQCMAALYIRFHKNMTDLLRGVKTTSASQEMNYSDLPSVFLERCLYAMKYIKRKLDAGEEVNCQQFIAQSIHTEKANLGHRYGMYDKYKAVGKGISMDHVIGSDKDGNEKTIGDTLADESSCTSALGTGITVEMLIQDYFNREEFDKAIIVDAISHNEKNVPTIGSIKKYIKQLTEESAKFYSERYRQNIELVNKQITIMQNYTPSELNRCYENTINELRAALM